MDLRHDCRHVEFFDSYGLIPIQEGTRSLMEAVKACDWRNNEHELQDILDTKSVACGYHCAIYLLAKTLLQISVDHINTIYPNEGCNQEDNDTFAVWERRFTNFTRDNNPKNCTLISILINKQQ